MALKRPTVAEADSPPPFNQAYFDTVFLVPNPPEAWPRQFAIVTAHNPDGALAVDKANDQAARALDRYLRDEGIESFAVVGASPDLHHHEAGRGFAAAYLETAATVSRKFRQEAFFWVEDGVVYLCIDESGRGWRMANWNDRLRRSH